MTGGIGDEKLSGRMFIGIGFQNGLCRLLETIG